VEPLDTQLLGPRLVVAGTHSGAGKTTVATGLLAALRAAGHRPAGAKVGPDFIDPGYHSLACGRPPRNLDAWLCGVDAVGPLAARAAAGADVLVVEGVMGLFDGAADGTPSSTADIARRLDAPVVLVVDAASLSSSVAAVVHGFTTIDPTLRVGGVVLNRVASEAHRQLLLDALAPLGVPVLGTLRRDDRLVWRDRHLGLVPVAEQPGTVAATLDGLAAAVGSQVDLAAVIALARSAQPLEEAAVSVPAPLDRPTRVAVAGGRAFTFTYADTVEALGAAGAEVVGFDPLRDEALPDAVDGLVVGGGFPETYAADLAANRRLLADVRRRIGRGLVTWAECGGLAWLCTDLDGHPMAGVVAASATMTDRLRLGYREADTTVHSPLGPAGTRFRGHEFHYSRVSPGGDALALTSRFVAGPDGHATPSLMASYLHHHPGGDPSIVANFVARCAGVQPGVQG
jgi:cobyrinic acid a,c-diamide synthase